MKKRCQVKSSCLVGLQTGRHTFKRLIFLTLSLIFLSWSSASFACSVHDHGCIFHSFNSTVQVNPPIVPTNNNALVIYAIGTNGIGGTSSAIDFDNKVLLPANTGDKFLVGSPTNYNIPTGPYIVSSTSYGAANPPPVWSPAGGAGALQVYPSQYQVIFNQNTAVAKHTGDLNGGENGNIPNATGCPNKPGAANCEAVVVTGNVPNGLYEQKVRIFNFQNTPNPQVDIQYGAYVTGQLAMVNASHETNATASFAHLSGNGDITPTAVYEVYNRGFNPHASGTAWFDRSKNRISGYSNPYQQGTHVYQDKFITNTLTRTTVQGNGDSSQHSTNTYGVVKIDLGGYVEVMKPVIPQIPMLPDNSNKLLTGAGSLLGSSLLMMSSGQGASALKLPSYFDFGHGLISEYTESSLNNSKVRIGDDFTIRYRTPAGGVSYGNQYFSTASAGKVFKAGGIVVSVASQGVEVAEAFQFDDGGVIGKNTTIQAAGTVGNIGGGILGGAVGGSLLVTGGVLSGTACVASVICPVLVIGGLAVGGAWIGETAEEKAVKWQLNNLYK